MVFRETVGVYFQNHMKHISALCEQKAEFRNVYKLWYT